MKKITQLPNKIRQYLEEDFETLDLNKYVDIDNPEDYSVAVKLPLSGGRNMSAKLFLSNIGGYSDKRTLVSENGVFLVNNLYSGQKYTYTVAYSDGIEVKDEFETCPVFPRLLSVDGLRNVRDFGGSMSRFGRLKQGLLLRGSEMNLIRYDSFEYTDNNGKNIKIDNTMNITDKCVKSILDHGIEITEDGRKTMLQELGVKTDIDFRYESESGAITSSPLGDTVNYYRFSILGYMNMFKEEFIESIRKTMLLLSDRKNYPIYMHCWAGADRTGTLISVLKMFLGVSEEDIIRDHELSTMSIFGARGRGNREFTYPEVFEYIKSFKADTLAKSAERYFTEKIGLEKSVLDKIASILADGYVEFPESKKREEYIADISKFKAEWEDEWQPPVWTHDFEEKSRQFSSKSGRVMAFGHRGDIEHYPENSIEGIISAVKMGADGVEIDCCYTSDGVIVLNHGSKLQPTTDWDDKYGKIVNGIELPTSGNIEDWTFLQLRQLNLRFGGGKYSDKDSVVTGYKIATLKEAMTVCRNRCFMSLDRMRRGGLSSPDWENVYALVKETDAYRSILYLNMALSIEEADELRESVKKDYGEAGPSIFDRTGTHNCAIEWFKEFGFTDDRDYDEYYDHCARSVGTYILSNRLTHLLDWIDKNYFNQNK